jgi:hypothetical protein
MSAGTKRSRHADDSTLERRPFSKARRETTLDRGPFDEQNAEVLKC